jgi:hypothetical protein
MILSRWKKSISQRCIFSDEDGRLVAFPFGHVWPHVAFILPDARTQSRVLNAIFWPHVAAIPFFVATFAVIKVYSLPFYTFWLALALQSIFHCLLVSFVTHKCVRLSFVASIRAFASHHDFAILYDYAVRFTFFAILFTALLVVLPIDPFLYLMPIWTIGLATIYWYMVIRGRQHRATSEAFRDKPN